MLPPSFLHNLGLKKCKKCKYLAIWCIVLLKGEYLLLNLQKNNENVCTWPAPQTYFFLKRHVKQTVKQHGYTGHKTGTWLPLEEWMGQDPVLPKSCLLYPSLIITTLPTALHYHSSMRHQSDQTLDMLLLELISLGLLWSQ